MVSPSPSEPAPAPPHHAAPQSTRGSSAAPSAHAPRAGLGGAEPPALIGNAESFVAFRERLERAASSEATVLLQGESGAGKGHSACHLHARSRRAAGPLVVIDLAAAAPSLLEATLFGHERGAFTDAHRSRTGLLRKADGGTLVLDDVDLLPLDLQPKLLRALQERVVEPLGAEAPLSIDVRLVATTHRDLAGEVQAGRFRSDLYYRLAVVTLDVPPLRARAGDLALLVPELVGRVAQRLGVPPRAAPPEVLARLERHAWPGNVRELENALERVLALAGGAGTQPLDAQEFAFLEEARRGVPEELARAALSHGLTVEELTTAMLKEALAEQHGNVSRAARRVGLTRRAFDYRLARGSAEDDGQG